MLKGKGKEPVELTVYVWAGGEKNRRKERYERKALVDASTAAKLKGKDLFMGAFGYVQIEGGSNLHRFVSKSNKTNRGKKLCHKNCDRMDNRAENIGWEDYFVYQMNEKSSEITKDEGGGNYKVMIHQVDHGKFSTRKLAEQVRDKVYKEKYPHEQFTPRYPHEALPIDFPVKNLNTKRRRRPQSSDYPGVSKVNDPTRKKCWKAIWRGEIIGMFHTELQAKEAYEDHVMKNSVNN